MDRTRSYQAGAHASVDESPSWLSQDPDLAVLEGGFASMAMLPSNVDAVRLTAAFVAGRINFGVIIGPSGCGKSLLLRSAAERLGGRSHGHPPLVASGALLDSPSGSRTGHLLIDDAQDVLPRLRTRQEFRSILETRTRLNRPTLLAIAADQPIRGLRSVLPGWEWQLAWVQAPKKEERQAVLRSMARGARLQLSDRLVRFLAGKLGGSNACMLGAVQCLELVRSDWLKPKRELQALGLLKGYLHDATGWDLRDFVHESAHRSLSKLKLNISECQCDAIAVRLMLDCCGLCERDAADYFGWDSGETYGKLNAARTLVDSEFPGVFRHCCEALLQAIDAA